MKRKHYLVLLLVIGLLVMSLFGCASQKDSTPDAGEPDETGQKTIDYPTKTITIISPTSAGGGYDLGARLIAKYLPKYLPNKVECIVENMPGAGQMIGVHAVYAAEPDGYTLGAFNAVGALMAQFLRSEEVQFDMNKFAYLGMWQRDVRAIGLSNALDVSTWDELVERSKKSPILTGTGGIGTGQHIDPLMVEAVSDLKLKYIHYDGSAQIEPGMGRGEIEMEMAQLATIENLKEQKFGRTFCVISDKRHPLAPDVPTALEVGMPQEVFDKLMSLPFFGVDRVVAAPPGTDPEIVEILRKALWDVFQDPEYQAEAESMQMENNPMKGEEYEAVVKTKIKAAEENEEMIEQLKF